MAARTLTPPGTVGADTVRIVVVRGAAPSASLGTRSVPWLPGRLTDWVMPGVGARGTTVVKPGGISTAVHELPSGRAQMGALRLPAPSRNCAYTTLFSLKPI